MTRFPPAFDREERAYCIPCRDGDWLYILNPSTRVLKEFRPGMVVSESVWPDMPKILRKLGCVPEGRASVWKMAPTAPTPPPA